MRETPKRKPSPTQKRGRSPRACQIQKGMP